jgi:hypothetical protein
MFYICREYAKSGFMKMIEILFLSELFSIWEAIQIAYFNVGGSTLMPVCA